MKIGDGRCSVLVVDALKSGILEVLNRDGAFVAVGATNGQDALRQLKAGVLANVILTDLMMPVMNGAQLREALSREPAFNAIPIIVLSGEPRAVDSA